MKIQRNLYFFSVESNLPTSIGSGDNDFFILSPILLKIQNKNYFTEEAFREGYAFDTTERAEHIGNNSILNHHKKWWLRRKRKNI
jgi:hypothetical protein